MTNGNKNSNDLWSLIGKAGIVIALIWTLIQIYDNFFKPQEYQAEANGSHSFYETSPIHKKAYKNANEYKALVKAAIEKRGALKSYELDSLISKVEKGKDEDLKPYYDFNKSLLSDYEDFEIDSYNEIWYFIIKNTGNKPLEELSLELPFEGSCKVILSNNVFTADSFKNKVIIGELRPSYEAKIVVWSNNSLGKNEDLSRFTHKYGWLSIHYPIQVTGFYAWNKKQNDIPLIIIAVFISFILFFFGAYLEGKARDKMGKSISESEEQNNDKSE